MKYNLEEPKGVDSIEVVTMWFSAGTQHKYCQKDSR
jgi:hypothetical protein